MKKFSPVILLIVVCGAYGYGQSSPSLAETFDWITNTLKPSEGNNAVVHRHHKQPYSKEWVTKDIDPYHSEVIKTFSHDGCRVRFEVDIADNDMGLLLGKHFIEHDIDTFDLKDIDPRTVQVENSCESVQTTTGPIAPFNCEDTQGDFVTFRTADAKIKIHEEAAGSSQKSLHGLNQVKHHAKYNLDEMCKEAYAAGGQVNPAYCDEPEHQEKPAEKTSSSLGFSTPEYAKRFVQAFKHAIELCGGKQSAF